MGGPDRPGGRAEQRGREALRLEEGGGGGGIGGVVIAVREGVADGGGRGCCHRRQVSGEDLSGQRLTLMLLPQNQLYLVDKDTTQSGQDRM